MKNFVKLFFCLFLLTTWALAQEEEVLDTNDIDALLEEIPKSDEVATPEAQDVEKVQTSEEILDELDTVDVDTAILNDSEKEKDDLEALKQDIGDFQVEELKDENLTIDAIKEEPAPEAITTKEEGKEEAKDPFIPSTPEEKKEAVKIVNGEEENKVTTPLIFDVGKEEKELLQMAQYIQGKTSNKEWDEIATASTMSSYTVVEGDWLWKISEKLFGSGFYYPKIWSLNPYITNPHLIEPGMTLVFTTGSADNFPELKLGTFSDSEKARMGDQLGSTGSIFDYSTWGDGTPPVWFKEKQELVDQGTHVQYSTADSVEDIQKISEKGLITEYKKYTPVEQEILVKVPEDQYDSSGFDKNAKIVFPFKEGYYLTTFLSTNIVQDFGKIDSAIKEGVFLFKGDKVFLEFDRAINVIAGDKFSIYTAEGKVSHKNSDRVGYKYTVVANVQTIAKREGLWLAEITDSSGVAKRGDRITVYTPKIERITRTFNDQIIEAALIGGASPLQKTYSFGDVLYLDRGRADGVEVGNVFEIYDFKDRLTGKNITRNPAYKTGEVAVITLSDNFSTALVTQSQLDFYIGDIAVTKSKDSAARSTKFKDMNKERAGEKIKAEELEELDVDLNVDNMSDALLDKADQIKFTEDELAELERQEREKSILKENEKDLRSLEKLEEEIQEAESMLNEAKLDEDKKLEQLNIENVESETKAKADESLEEIEENLGKKFMDENLPESENPYGLTEFDIEEIDELLNAEKKQQTTTE
ncbi:MAG: LysM peptidoglycan-binding domain-containing protein [Bacteriovoracaceae bacterium]|nr:LysM peptidoglycan-binding domain-containing protein [Bacteriovoracaceae bacterium]